MKGQLCAVLAATVAGGFAVLCLTESAWAGAISNPPTTIKLRVDDSRSPMVQIELVQLSLTSVHPVIVPPMAPAFVVRDMILNKLNLDGVPAAPGPLPNELVIPNLSDGSPIRFNTAGTCQASNQLSAENALGGGISFSGLFDPFDQTLQPAIFTAGIVTDVGELTAHVSAQELNFQTDGPIICQALFQRLAPHAPQYGAQINFAGDRLEVYFDPAYSVTQGGVIFGTTSPSQQGTTGELLVPMVPVVCPGDVDGDGQVSVNDISYVVFRLGNSGAPGTVDGDADENGSVDVGDITFIIFRLGTFCS